MTLKSRANVFEAAPGVTGLDVLSPASTTAPPPAGFSVPLAIKHLFIA